jgi:hypothetical protein
MERGAILKWQDIDSPVGSFESLRPCCLTLYTTRSCLETQLEQVTMASNATTKINSIAKKERNVQTGKPSEVDISKDEISGVELSKVTGGNAGSREAKKHDR